MDFDDCPYSVQQVPPRSRDSKVLVTERDLVEKARICQRVEKHIRVLPYGNIVKEAEDCSGYVDDVDRFNRDYTLDQKATKRMAAELTLARAATRRRQQIAYENAAIEERRLEALEFSKMQDHMRQHNLLDESVCYDPATNQVPPETTPKGAQQRTLDATKETFREARARRIQHMANSEQYDPITGYARTFW
jgi:hypothetical protein